MSYKIKNAYKEAHIMELNLLGINENKTVSFSGTEIILTLAPLLIAGVVAAMAFLPEFSFLAECVNIGATGDVCHIAMQ